jgi:hypothetical protein
MRVQDQNVADPGKTYMEPFWRENQLVGSQKEKLIVRALDLKNQDAS